MKIMFPEICTAEQSIEIAAAAFQRANLHFGHGTCNAQDDALAIVMHVLQQPFETHESWLHRNLSAVQRNTLLHLFQRRLDERVPAAYLTGEA